MSMDPQEIEKMIKQEIPGSNVTIYDLAGDNNHYSAEIISDKFHGKTRIQQHQMVYAALKGKMGNTLHALSIKTSVPNNHNSDK
ncbi:MAG: BolA family transcriptional regulator [Candidatus Liberibacter europaeus]|uniref:BolA family transcriptional regulator n=1 Tax=Candidatus Liberibacter europaeus TaxID=744859 RepID=A0A2T4VWZ1_9HYPH|nr:BolA family transcriptional regulator [Candidatus Liberibacter europaeus]PTL86291.1 MAG: BolA family transcriptional regulator [Candidatus Liberibacter europaeus]